MIKENFAPKISKIVLADFFLEIFVHCEGTAVIVKTVLEIVSDRPSPTFPLQMR